MGREHVGQHAPKYRKGGCRRRHSGRASLVKRGSHVCMQHLRAPCASSPKTLDLLLDRREGLRGFWLTAPTLWNQAAPCALSSCWGGETKAGIQIQVLLTLRARAMAGCLNPPAVGAMPLDSSAWLSVDAIPRGEGLASLCWPLPSPGESMAEPGSKQDACASSEASSGGDAMLHGSAAPHGSNGSCSSPAGE